MDREEYLEWMDEALKRCKDQTVVLHLRGIGGIGKSSLLDYWTNNIDSNIRLDCQQYSEFYPRLNSLAKGAVLLGVRLPRFDVLWQIRQRFVEGVEPVKEEGREWAKDVVMAVPFIGSLASIGIAIKAVASKVTPKFKGKYSSLGKWLEEVLGKNHVERLLEILWKDPHYAEFLFLDALLEDLNDRKNLESPLLLLFDHFEYVDAETTHWRYSGKQITETELWCVFLSSLSNSVGVMASRRSAIEPPEISVEESELTELDRESCLELLELRGVSDSDLQERIVSVSGGNPFVIGTLCDMTESSSISLESVESLRADTLEEVRLKTWRKLFNEVQDLQELVNRAGLLPNFNRNVMNIITPTMNTDQWTRMVNLSFVKDRGDGTYVMHDLARDLVVAELGGRFRILADEVAELLEKVAEKKENMKLLGLSISVQGLHSPESAIQKILDITDNQSWRFQFHTAIELLDSISFGTRREQVIISSLKPHFLICLDRVAEAEHILKEAIEVLEELSDADPESNLRYLGGCCNKYGWLLYQLRQPIEAEMLFEKALQIIRKTEPAILRKNNNLRTLFWHYSSFLTSTFRLNKAANLLRYALDQGTELIEDPRERAFYLSNLSNALYLSGKMDEGEAVCRETLEIRTEDVVELNSLNNLGLILIRTSRPHEAVRMYQRMVDLAQELSKREEGFSLAALAFHTMRYGYALRVVREYTEAETQYKEALEEARKSTSDNPEIYLPFLTNILEEYATLCYETGQYSKAKQFYEELLEYYERLIRDWPERYNKYFAGTLNNYSVLLRVTGEESRARKFYLEALSIGRDVAEKYPENIFHSWLLVNVLSNLGVLHRKMNENKKAEEALGEALEIRHAQEGKIPDFILGSVATTLNNLGVVLSTTSRLSEAQEIFCRGLEISRELVEKSPDMYSHSLAGILNNLGNLHKLFDEFSEAEQGYQEAIEILEKLALKANSIWKRDLTSALSNLSLLYIETDKKKKSEDIKTKIRELGVSEFNIKESWIEIDQMFC